MVRKSPLEILYTDRCDIYNWESVKDPTTKVTEHKKVLRYENIPCRVSFKTISAVNQSTFEPVISQVVKLFLSKDIEIKAGSEIVVYRGGKVLQYKCSGLPAVYSNHQEIILLSAEEKA
nr:MAG TPA: head closure knob [Caudoviricetes sp.]